MFKANTQKETNQLIQKINAFKNRSDLNIEKVKINPPANKNILDNSKGKFPESLLDFYRIANGLIFYATAKETKDADGNLFTIRLNILPLESLMFDYNDDNMTNFPKGSKYALIEFGNGDFTSYLFLKNKNDNINKAKIVSTYPSEEEKHVVTGKSFGSYLKRLNHNNLNVLWADKGYSKSTKIINKALNLPSQ